MKEKKVIILAIIICIILLIIFITTSKNNNYNKLEEEIQNDEDIIEEQINIRKDNLENSKIVDNIKINTSKLVSENHHVAYVKESLNQKDTSLIVSDMNLYSDLNTDMATAEFTLKNTSKNVLPKGIIIIFFLNKEGNQIFDFNLNFDEIPPNGEKKLNFTYPQDFIVAYDYIAKYDN